MIRIVIADDHAMMRAGLVQIMAGTDDVVVVGEADHGNTVIPLLRNLDLDVLLLDLNMPGLSGLDLIQRIRHESPTLPILVVSMHEERPLVSRTLKMGAAGYVTKRSEPGVLLTAVRKLAAGERYIDPCLVNELIFDSMISVEKPHNTLTNREYQVLQMFVQGRTVTEMAGALRLSVKTVSTHKSNIKEKLGLQADAELFRYAIDHKL